MIQIYPNSKMNWSRAKRSSARAALGGIEWSKNVDIITFDNAWHTWNTFARKKYKPSLTFEKFYKAAFKGQYKDVTVAQFLRMKPQNAGVHRFQAKTPKEAYPDKPRGEKDLKSILYHMRTKNCISPIVLIRAKGKLIKLDGVHRALAAKFRRSKIRMLIIKA